MSKILFSHSYFYQFDKKQWKTKKPYPPLGTIYAAAFMRKNNHQVALFDVALEKDETKLIEHIQQEKPDFFVMYDDGFNYLTKMCLTNMREASFRMLKLAKQNNITTIVCSSDSTDHYESYLNNGADFVILGEGELKLKELIEKLDKKQTDFESIEGISYKKDARLVTTPKRNVIKDLDSLPQPAWDLIDIDKYKNIWVKNHGYFSLNIATTRGCPYKCNWCAKPIYGNRYNSRSASRVADEIEFLIKNFKPTHFWMCDDIFGLKPNWVNEFNTKVQKRNLKFKYTIQSRADLLLTENNIELLAKSGLQEVWIGAESGSQKILDAMDKGTTLEQIENATKLLKSYNIKVAFFLQFGYLGETLEDINLTLEMLTKLMPDEIGISVSYPLPGTGFYEKVKEDLKSKSNWTDSDDLALMFKNTYHTDFYKNLQRFVHRNYRKLQAIKKIKSRKIDSQSIKFPYYWVSSKYYSNKVKKLESNFKS